MRLSYYSILIRILICNLCICQEVIINELISSNFSVFMDRDAEYSDWIEMTNVSNDTFDLTGFWLSDDFSEPQRWSIPELKIAPGE